MPPLCQAHRVVFQNVAQNESRSPFQAVADLFDSFLNGGKITQADIRSAYDDIEQVMRGGMGGQNMGDNYRPPVDARQGQPRAAPDHGHHGEYDNVPPGGQYWDTTRGGPSHHQNSDPPPRIDPDAHLALLRARALLGFKTGDRITTDSLRARHRELAMKHHPDRGGSLAKMQAINAAVDTVAASL